MIRLATHDDIPQIVDLADQMHDESAFAPYDFDSAKLSNLIGTLINVGDGIVLVADDIDDPDGCRLSGAFLGCVYPHFFGNDYQAIDYGLFVRPENRGSSIAARLIREYVAMAKAFGAKQIMLANSTGYEPDRVANMYERFGFRKVGYVMELSNV